MKKRLLSYILIMVMLFAATVPSFAVQDVSVSSFYNASSGVGINAGQLMQSLLNSVVAINSKLPAVTSTGTVFENIDTRLGHIESWLVPENSAGTNPSLYQLILELGIAAQSYLPYIPTISNYVGSWMISNNGYLNDLKYALSNLRYGATGANSFNDEQLRKNSHYQLYDTASDRGYGYYHLNTLLSDGHTLGTQRGIQWQYGSPIGNIAVILKNINDNYISHVAFRSIADLKHYNDTLTTWETQYDDIARQYQLKQVEFTPESAIQGLYRYLAYIQKDTAKLQHVIASEDDIALRNKTMEDVSMLTTNIYGNNSDNSPSTQNWFDVGDVGTGIKENMNTGASATHIFDLFKGDKATAWFSQETANELNNTGSGNRSLKASAPQPVYETPLLDKQVNEIMSIFGGGQ